jgi:hypothetical protein
MTLRRYEHRPVAGEIVYNASRSPRFLLVATATELPSSEISGGDLAYVEDSERLLRRTDDEWVDLGSASSALIQRGAAFVSPSGALAVVSWRAPYSCVVTNVRGYRIGGSGATVNARRVGYPAHLSTDLSLTSADAWLDGGAVQSATYAVGDALQIDLVSVSGSPDQVVIQVDLRRI